MVIIAPHGHETVCRALLDACPSRGQMLNLGSHGHGLTALHEAVLAGHETACRLLVEAAPSVE
eukprot:10078487-Prorocentrum_lima.AAC.1